MFYPFHRRNSSHKSKSFARMRKQLQSADSRRRGKTVFTAAFDMKIPDPNLVNSYQGQIPAESNPEVVKKEISSKTLVTPVVVAIQNLDMKAKTQRK